MPNFYTLISVKKTCLLLFSIFTTLFLQAQNSTVSSIASTVSTTIVSGGTDWTTPNSIQTADDVFATSLITGSNKPTYTIDAKNWGFQASNSSQPNYIPPSAIINGIEVSVKMRRTLTGTLYDNKVILLKAGVETGTNKARNATKWPTTATYITFGSSTDTWGASWTASDLTNSGFGIRISARNKGGKDAQAEIDHIYITLYFNQSYFYSKSTGNLENTATWGLNSDGTGTAPADFTGNGQVFFLRNRSSVSLTNNFTISGTDSRLVIGDGTAATALTIPSAYSLNALVDINANSTLTVSNSTVPTLVSIADNTSVAFNTNGNQTIPNVAYYNLTIGGSGTKTIAANASNLATINNVLTINSGATLNNGGNNVVITGASTGLVNNGTATGSGKYTYALVDVSTSISGTGVYSHLEIDAGTSTTAKTVTLSNPTTITQSLTLSDGIFANGANLTMGSGSSFYMVDGVLNNTFSNTNYDVNYSSFSGTSKTTGGELNGSIRNVTVQIPGGTTLNLGSNLSITGNLLVSSGTLDPTNSNYNITVGGDFTNNATITSRNNTVTFNGSTVQTIGGTSAVSFYKLTINNATGGSVLLNAPVSVSNALTLTKGIVTTSSSNPLTVGASGSISGGSSTSYIDGVLKQTVAALSSTKTFPIGKANAYRPVTLSVSHTNTVATIYTAELFAGIAPVRTLPADLRSLFSVRYYTISNGGSSNFAGGTVTINYGIDDGVTVPGSLRIAKSNGALNWMNIGGTGSAVGTGTITSGMFYGFSDFVLANSEDITLPVTWQSFTGAQTQTAVNLNWTTANEVNNKNFMVERSADAKNWTTIGTVISKGKENNEYSFADHAPNAVNYYRIKQVDADGNFSYSKIIQLNVDLGKEKRLVIYPNPVLQSSFNCQITDPVLLSAHEISVKVIDATGKIVRDLQTKPSPIIQVQTGKLPSGWYIVRIQNADNFLQTTMVVP